MTCSPTSCAVSTGSDRRQPRHERRHPVPSRRRRQDRCARIAGKNVIPRHQRRQLVLNHPDRRKDGCHSKANCTSSGVESHSTGWEGSIWGIPVKLNRTRSKPLATEKKTSISPSLGTRESARPNYATASHYHRRRALDGIDSGRDNDEYPCLGHDDRNFSDNRHAGPRRLWRGRRRNAFRHGNASRGGNARGDSRPESRSFPIPESRDRSKRGAGDDCRDSR